MWNDVIDDGRHLHTALLPAFSAEVVFRLAEEGGARFVPAAVIAALARRRGPNQPIESLIVIFLLLMFALRFKPAAAAANQPGEVIMKRLLGLVVVLSLGIAATSLAQDADLQARADEGNAAYAEAWAAGDVDALVEMFTEDAIYWPPGGGRYEGREEIRRALQEQPTPTSATIATTHVERMNGTILDVGTFTVTMPEDAGGEMRGEFVAVLTEEGDDLLIRRLIGFPVREAPSGQ